MVLNNNNNNNNINFIEPKHTIQIASQYKEQLNRILKKA
jgi:hypothetical protein